MSPEEVAARREVVDAALAMSRERLSPGRSGNVSRRWAEGMLITPSGVAYETLAPEDVVPVDLDGNTPPGGPRPSSEWQIHAAIYAARSDAGAVVHCHSQNATILACARRAIPAFNYMVAVAGGRDIRCAPYATFGTGKLAEGAVAALQGRRACLLAHHGQVAIGARVAAALEMAREVETLAAQYCGVLALGEPQILDDAEMDAVIERFGHYGASAPS